MEPKWIQNRDGSAPLRAQGQKYNKTIKNRPTQKTIKNSLKQSNIAQNSQKIPPKMKKNNKAGARAQKTIKN